MPIQGIGGYFFRSRDPAKLKDWYREQLGVGASPDAHGSSWHQQAGPCEFEPFRADTDYFGPQQQAMINFRVSDLDDLVATLRSRGIAVEREEEMEGVGRFARIHDPEGNAIELWEPA